MSAERAKFPSGRQDQFVVRFPEGMRDEIASAAKAAGRSMNAEIVSRIAGEAATLRDKLAGQALIGFGTWMPRGYTNVSGADALKARAELAYSQADAMIAARKAGA